MHRLTTTLLTTLAVAVPLTMALAAPPGGVEIRAFAVEEGEDSLELVSIDDAVVTLINDRFGSKISETASMIRLRMSLAEYENQRRWLDEVFTKYSAVGAKVEIDGYVEKVDVGYEPGREQVERARARYNSGNRKPGAPSKEPTRFNPSRHDIDPDPNGSPKGSKGSLDKPERGDKDPAETDPEDGGRQFDCNGPLGFLCGPDVLPAQGDRDPPRDGGDEETDCDREGLFSIICIDGFGPLGGDSDPASEPTEDDELDCPEDTVCCGPDWPHECSEDDVPDTDPEDEVLDCPEGTTCCGPDWPFECHDGDTETDDPGNDDDEDDDDD